MSVENNKICCNCRHNKRTPKQTHYECHCDIDGHYIDYVQCMEHWCRRWAKESDNLPLGGEEIYRARWYDEWSDGNRVWSDIKKSEE